MPTSVFYFDPPGPLNFKAPWLTFPSGDLLAPGIRRGRAAKAAQVAQRKTDTPRSSGDRAEELLRKRQRQKRSPKPQIISLISSDDEGGSCSRSLPAQNSRQNRLRNDPYQTKISQDEVNKGMAAAKRLSRAAIRPTPEQVASRPALSEVTARQLPGIRRFGTHTNSVELKDRRFLVKLGFLSPKRPKFSEPTDLKDLAQDTEEWVTPRSDSPNPLNPSSIPPSSFIPLDVD
ncbi:hypothetical protein F5B19DRAFT_386314 [Rostrohypoxylon terebratum]|nr:hypothetical protein F5B19DRAFT_386314 [Rostrohypoxylon terebratum]